MLGHPLGVHVSTGGDGVSQCAGELLVFDPCLGRRVGLGARLGDGLVHLGEHVHDLGEVGATLDGDGQSLGAGHLVVGLGHGLVLSVIRECAPCAFPFPFDNINIPNSCEENMEEMCRFYGDSYLFGE